MMVEKKRNLEHLGGGGGGWGVEGDQGWRSKWAVWLNILAIATHAKQIRTQKKNMQIPA